MENRFLLWKINCEFAVQLVLQALKKIIKLTDFQSINKNQPFKASFDSNSIALLLVMLCLIGEGSFKTDLRLSGDDSAMDLFLGLFRGDIAGDEMGVFGCDMDVRSLSI